MKFALPAAAAALLSLWIFFIRRRLTILRANVDQAFKCFHAQQLCRINALAALVELTNEYAPGAVRIRSDVVQSCCAMVSSNSSMKDIGKRERTASQILTQITQAVRTHPEMRSDAHYSKCMSEMDFYESLSNTNRLRYNSSVNKLNRELRRFPVSGRLLGFRKREYIEG